MNGHNLITGACGGLGGAFVRSLAGRGEDLYLTGRSGERLSALAGDVQKQYGVDVGYAACDLRNSDERIAFFARLEREGVRVKRLVYVAGVDTQMAFEKYGEEKIVLQARANFEGAVSFIRGALALCAPGECEILIVGSVSGLCPMPYFALYSATKKALEQFCLALRVELKGRAKVCCVLPGAIPTRADVKAYIAAQGLWGRLAALPPEKVAAKALKAVGKNRGRVVIGFWNKCLQMFMKIVPLRLKLRFIARRWGKTEKDGVK